MIRHGKRMTDSTRSNNRAKATSIGWRLVRATIFATCVMSTACAVTDEQPETPPQPTEPASSERAVALGIVIALKNCVTTGVSRLSRHSYELSFEVEATPKGVIQEVKSKGSRLDDAQMEACMIDALEGMSVRDFLPTEDSSPAMSKNVLPSSRSLIGTAETVLPQLIRLAPIVISASGVTIIVGVGVIVLVAAAVATMSAECVQEWEHAYEECLKQLESNDPDYGVTGGYINAKECARGLVRVGCGGNRVDDGGQPARPGRRT